MTAFAMDDLMFRPGLLRGQRILVTGGGTGLGKVMAEGFLMLGAEVYICGRRGGVLQDAAKELTDAHGGKCVGIACDIRDADSITSMMDAIWADGGALTGLVNNAAGNFISRTEDLSPRGFDAVTNIVFRGGFLCTLEVGKRWIEEKKKGSVVSILTTWIWNGGPFVVPSAMSKAGIGAMTQSLAVEWGVKGIRLNNIAPGPFPTEGMSARLDPKADGKSSGAYDHMDDNPMHRVGDMRELANLAVYLMHPLSEFVNGQTIAIDGGGWQANGGNFARLTDWTDQQWKDARESIRAATDADKAKRTV